MAVALFLLLTLAIIAVSTVLYRSEEEPVPEDSLMDADLSMCPLCDQPTGFMAKPPTIRYEE